MNKHSRTRISSQGPTDGGLSRVALHPQELNERAQIILRAIIQSYVLSANPVGSNALLKNIESELKVSSATVRNVMSELEELGYITHPHTSAGRIPTDKGYRTYVDQLMMVDALSRQEEISIRENLNRSPSESLYRDASKLLGVISQLLGVVQLPTVTDLIVRRVDLLPLSSTRLLIVMSFDSDVVRTLTVEADSIVPSSALEELSRMINERISGRSLRDVRDNIPAIMVDHSSHPVMRLFIDSMDKLFVGSSERLHIAGAQNLVQQPEFDNPDRLRGVVELIENEDVIVHLLERTQQDQDHDGVTVMIGSEIQNDLLRDFSFVSAQYRIAGSTYSVGLIGPKRMNYSRLVSLVGSVAHMMTSSSDEGRHS